MVSRSPLSAFFPAASACSSRADAAPSDASVAPPSATSAAESAAEIVAEAGAEATDQSAEEKTAEQTEERRVHRSERRYGKFERRFRLPKDAEFEAIDASAREGVLTVSIGRRKEEARRAIEVRVA